MMDLTKNVVKWEKMPSLPIEIFGGVMEYIDGYLYVIGGEIKQKQQINKNVYRLYTKSKIKPSKHSNNS